MKQWLNSDKVNARKIFYFSIGPVGGAVLGFITLPTMAWFFTPADIGKLTMLQVAISFSLLLFSLGLDQAYVREFHEVDDKPALLKAVVIPGQVILWLSIITISLLPWSVSEFLFGRDSMYLTILLFLSVLTAFNSRFLSLILRMQERGLAYSVSQVLPKLIFLVIIFTNVVFSFDAVFENLILAHLISLFSVFVIYAWNTRNQWIPAVSSSIDRRNLIQMIRYAIPLIGGGVAFWGLTAMDKFFLRELSSFEELGVYSMAVSFAGAALVFRAIFSTVWAPVVYKWAAEGVNPAKIKEVIDYVTLAVIVIWSLAGMFSWLTSYILPPPYKNVQFILIVAMTYPLLYTLSEATGVGIGIKRKTIYTMLAAIVALVVNGIGNYFLIPLYGAGGAAMASAISFMVFFIIKTEASSFLWESFDRSKMYLLVITSLSFSLLINTVDISVLFGVVFWFLLMLIALALYKKQLIAINFTITKQLKNHFD